VPTSSRPPSLDTSSALTVPPMWWRHSSWPLSSRACR